MSLEQVLSQCLRLKVQDQGVLSEDCEGKFVLHLLLTYGG